MAKIKEVAPATIETPANGTVLSAKPATPTEKIYTNEKIVSLNADRLAALKAAKSAEIDSKEETDNLAKASSIKAEIAKEIASMKTAERDAEQAEKKAAKTLLVTTFEDTFLAYSKIDASQPEDIKNAATDAYHKAKDAILNILYGGISASKPAAISTPAGGEGSRGATTAAIRAVITPMYEGVTKENVTVKGKEIRSHVIGTLGFNDGTANAEILKYERQLGLKD